MWAWIPAYNAVMAMLYWKIVNSNLSDDQKAVLLAHHYCKGCQTPNQATFQSIWLQQIEWDNNDEYKQYCSWLWASQGKASEVCGVYLSNVHEVIYFKPETTSLKLPWRKTCDVNNDRKNKMIMISHRVNIHWPVPEHLIKTTHAIIALFGCILDLIPKQQINTESTTMQHIPMQMLMR